MTGILIENEHTNSATSSNNSSDNSADTVVLPPDSELTYIVNFTCPELEKIRRNISANIGKQVICLAYGESEGNMGQQIYPFRAICEDGTAHTGSIEHE